MAKKKNATIPLEQLMKPLGLTPNVPEFNRQVYNDGKRAVGPACENLRHLAQNIIDAVEDHRHLRMAKILLLVESSEAAARKCARGEYFQWGRAYRATPIQRVLGASLATEAERKKPKGQAEKELDPPLPGFDFIVKLSGDFLTASGWFDGEARGVEAAAALIDHELLHCGVRIAGEFVERAKLATFVSTLKQLHVETCNDIQDDEGRILVRYEVWDGARPVWKMRRHDLEEFHGVVARWGAWDRAVGRLVDVLVEREKLPAGVALSMGSEKATA
ncbi:MAG: hypothetical protein GX591_17865 [Planctomycetes bacterium]|nr:hypothetical protein [Planctomycetota bacterium]